MGKVLNSLLERGFIIDCDVMATVESKTISELKSLLSENGISATGKKDELVGRAIKNISEEKLKNCLGKLKYGRTEKGEDALRNSEYVIFLHKHNKYDVDVWEISSEMNNSTENWHDKLWGVLNRKSIEAIGRKMFGAYRNIKFNMFDFLCYEEKYTQAYNVLIEVIYYDMNDWIDTVYDKDAFPIFLASYFDVDNILKIPRGTFDIMKDLQKRLSITDDKLRDDFVSEWTRLKVPFKIFSIEECAEIYFLEREGSQTKLKRIYSERKKKYASIIKEF